MSREPSTRPGRASATSEAPPSSATRRATAATPRRAMSRPLSGSRTANARSSNETCGQRRAASSIAIRSDRHVQFAQRGQRRRLEAVLAMGEPHDAGLHEAGLADLVAEGNPFLARLARPAHVERVGPCDAREIRVSSPDVARGLPAPNASTSVTLRPAADRLERRPGAHRPRADDDEVAHGWRTSVSAAASSMAAWVNGSGTVSPVRHGSIRSL